MQMIAMLGASGFIGSSLAEAFVSQRKEPLAIDIVKPNNQNNATIRSKIIYPSLNHLSSIAPGLIYNPSHPIPGINGESISDQNIRYFSNR